MRIHRNFIAFVLFLGLAVGLHATIGLGLQLQAGNPSGATTDPSNHARYFIDRAQYAMDYNDTTREPNWVSWNLTSGDVGGSGRSPFTVDPGLPVGFYQVLTTDYSGSGYDRGHMCPSADRTITVADNQIVFHMSNMVPQAPDNNQGVWASFETYCRTLASAGNEILLITGPSGFAGSTIASGVGIPGYTWKIAVVVPLGPGTALSRITASTRVITIKVPNIAGIRSNPWEGYVVSAAQIESDTGYQFFTTLPASVANALRTVVDGQSPAGSPVITTQPTGQVAALGGSATFTVTATGNPTLLYQWLKDDVEITGATTSTLNLTAIQAADAAIYTVVVTNGIGSVTSADAALVISGLPPAIITPPTTHAAAAGTSTTFTVIASGSPTLTYQWRKGTVPLVNGGNVSGATSVTLLLSNVQAGDADSYDVVVTNSVNSAMSLPALLTVTPAAPVITNPPAPQTVAIGGTAVFTVGAKGTAPFSYQWRKGGVPLVDGGTLSGASTATLTLVSAQNADAGSYDVVVSNGVPLDATSPAVTLTVNAVVAGRLSYTGGTYAQNFDTLPISGTTLFTGLTAPYDLSAAPVNASGLTGWTLAATAGTPTLIAGTGTVTNGAAYSFGPAASTERALGTIASGSVVPRFGLTLVNNTGVTINQFKLSYVGEWWRNGGNTSLAVHTLPFSYAVGANDIASASPAFTPVAALGFTSPTPTSVTGAPVDGNAAANRVPIESTVTGLTWAPGQTLVLRWDDTNDTGNDHGLAIDDLAFTTLVAPPPVAPVVVSTVPVDGSVAVLPSAPITINFAQPVTVAGSWFSINSALNGAVAATVTVSADSKTFTLTPPTNFADNDTITVTLFASQIVDQASGTLHPAANTVFSFSTAAPLPPSILTQPLPQTQAAGGTATFSVVAGGTPPFSYQWRQGGAAIVGNASAQTSTLTLTNVQAIDAATYDVVVSNGTLPAATSAAVALTVTPAAPVITTQPLPQTVANGATVTFTVAATGTTPFSYQWRKGGVSLSNGSVVSGVNSPTLTLTGVAVPDSGNYDVIVSNGVSPFATSVAALLTVNPPGIQTGYSGGTYAQNFNTLPAAQPVSGPFAFVGVGPFALDAAAPGVNATGMPGWSFAKHAGSGANALFKTDTGTSNAGGVNSYGSTAAAERALGSVSSGTVSSRFGVTFVNTSGATITNFTLRYTGEQWRHGGVITPNKLAFSYAVGANDINTATGFTAVTALDFTGPATTAVASALDGNVAANRVVDITGTISGLSWAPGQTLVLRWTDVDDTGADDGLAIDDLTFTTVPSAPVVTALVRHAPIVNGAVDGSVQLLLGENVSLNGNAWISGDLFVPGTPDVVLSGSPTYVGTIDGTGSILPTGYGVTLSGSSLLKHVVRRTDPVALPVVSAPPAPAGTRIVSLTTTAQSPGDFATLRNLSLNANAGLVAVPAGTYGSFSASGNSGFVLGVPGATVPSVYNFQSLAVSVLPGNAQLQIVGPVIVTLANGSLMNGASGSLLHPEWFTLKVAAGNLTISGNVTFNGHIIAPNSMLTLNGNATLNGTVIVDRLTLNGTSVLNDPN